ncbi:MAG: DNA mismatch repair endonuclease MutL [Pseudanabaenaceae cyanobacterium SKYGB_i_bin29]|nr:DNA mismatch repair endonuclease MutL [Pseudanabaenaceae cyanobacterium SKYG29]MDW8420940.1 DNA mismatch repair endonuclease MutL [Pseudanabaenaceae cyanobacterium SKYGB_i_bin29]
MGSGGIQPLDQTIVALISAGEVIDSPVAVVRELVENALDAQADRITINLWTEDDLFSVQVADNGVGMTVADLVQVAQPYSTSKIRQLQDLSNITSLGFRGEALHSIAQFSRLTIASRPQGQIGYQMRPGYDAPTPYAMAEGTIVTAERIFAHFAQRRAGLPDRSQQLRQIQKLIQEFALLHPAVTWQVELEKRPWFTLWGGASMAEIWLQIFPRCSETDVRELQQDYGRLLVGLPDRFSRPRPDWIKIAVNGRPVHVPELEQTVLAAFSHTLPRQRFPGCVVHLQVEGTAIDWQRHPAKREIYLHNIGEWQQRVEMGIRQLLQSPQPGLSSYGKQLFHLAESQANYCAAPPPKILGQLHRTYILVEQPEGLYLVEQHVAHERILFEQLESLWAIVPLAEPLLLTDLTEEQQENLNRAGIPAEPFGHNTWRITALPRLLVHHPDLPNAVAALSRESSNTALRARVACLAAVRNGVELDQLTMTQIVQGWQQCQVPHTCPHGRPIYFFLGKQRLDNFFRRY